MRRRYTVEWLAYQAFAPRWTDTERRFWTYRGALRWAAKKIGRPVSVKRWRVLRDGEPFVELERRCVTTKTRTGGVDHEPRWEFSKPMTAQQVLNFMLSMVTSKDDV